MDAKVTLSFITHWTGSSSSRTYNAPVPKTRQMPNFSARPIESFKISGMGSKSRTKSVEICVVAYDIHQGSFLKHREPGMLLSQKAAIGVHWKMVAIMKARLETTIQVFMAWQTMRNELLEIAKIL